MVSKGGYFSLIISIHCISSVRLNNLAHLPLGFDTSNKLNLPGGIQRESNSNQGSSHDVGNSELPSSLPNMNKKSSCTDEIEKIKVNRE